MCGTSAAVLSRAPWLRRAVCSGGISRRRESFRQWINQMFIALVPGHGAVAKHPNQAISTMRRYLSYLRGTMSAAVEDFIAFDEAYDATDWSEFEQLPAFAEANRRNAYQVYLSMEAESLSD